MRFSRLRAVAARLEASEKFIVNKNGPRIVMITSVFRRYHRSNYYFIIHTIDYLHKTRFYIDPNYTTTFKPNIDCMYSEDLSLILIEMFSFVKYYFDES